VRLHDESNWNVVR
jgi:transcription factor MYB, plant